MSMFVDLTEALYLIREIVQENAPPELRYSFEPYTGRDYSGNTSSDLYKQDGDFVVFDAEIDDSRRAGPSKVSPTRGYGTIHFSYYTKDEDDDLAHKRRLEVFSYWFAEKTVKNIRFRTYAPLSTVRAMGFLCFSGVLSFDFETTPKDVIS